MRVQHRQKHRERFLLERFLENAGLLAEILEEREAPDFIIRSEGRSIGVELTEMFISHGTTDNPKQAQESVSTRIVSQAREIYVGSGGQPAHVSIGFAPGRDLRKLNRGRTASDLASFVRSLGLTDGQYIQWRPETIESPLPAEISFVHALGVPNVRMAHWTVPRAGWVAPVTVEALQARVDEKVKRLRNYRDTVSENWLVIFADATKPSGLFDAQSFLEARKVASPFSRTFFYGYPDRVVVELGAQLG
jgi:hypothetical protein